jgi:squalene cyclase
VLLARAALGHRPEKLVVRVQSFGRGPTVNSAIWGILALRAAGERPPQGSVAYLLRRQTRAGGWSWSPRGSPDSNDTAAAIQALRAAGTSGSPIRRGLAFLRRFQRADGGYELTRRRGSDVQSTAWAIQAHVAAGRPPPARALRYLLRLQRRDGSFRYSARYAVTPTWVTAQALLALSRKALPLSSRTA